ncbi:hypothetical protein [Cesiribacter sp. SM1]|uniref:hypothetical protein n=1 Tax=Cesiribacter sp. SM1 TaxID=2861196 RepID=UPI001CD6AF4E|nr:hypothetical protein [Cesiribacter sp. SM1]
MCHIEISNQLARAIICLNSSGSLKDRLVFAALTLNDINTRVFPSSSLTSRYDLLLKELGLKGEFFSEEEVEGTVSSLTEQQQQAICAAIISMHMEVNRGEVFE